MVGWFWPVSMSEMKLRCTLASSPSCSWDKPAAVRARRKTAPKGSSKGPNTQALMLQTQDGRDWFYAPATDRGKFRST
jgi:hypothetical protein